MKILRIISGIILLIGLVILLFAKACNSDTNSTKKDNPPKTGNTAPSTVASYPISGKEIATMDKPIKAYLDPENSYTRIIGEGNAKYVLESNPSKFFICNEKPGVESGHIKDFLALPAGNYLIYPEGINKIVFKWWKR